MEVGHKLISCTANLETVVIDPGDRFPSLKNHRIVIVDTPGFDHAIAEEVKVLQRIVSWLAAS